MNKRFQTKQNENAPIATVNEERNKNVKNHLLVLLYKGSDAMHIISSMPKQVNRALRDDVKMIEIMRYIKRFSIMNMILCIIPSV